MHLDTKFIITNAGDISLTPMNNQIENRLWAAADQLWANSPLKPSEYSSPVLGLIFLKYADFKFRHVAAEISAKYKTSSRREPSKIDFQSKIGMSIPEKARFSYLKSLPEGADIGKAINEAMKLIEQENEDLRDVLPKNYQRIENSTLFELIRVLHLPVFDRAVMEEQAGIGVPAAEPVAHEPVTDGALLQRLFQIFPVELRIEPAVRPRGSSEPRG